MKILKFDNFDSKASISCLNGFMVLIKTHGSEREAKKKQHARESSGLRNHYSELFTQMAALKLENAITQPLYQFRLLNYRPNTF